MQQDGCLFDIDCATKLFSSIFVRGWFHHPTEKLARVSLSCSGLIAQDTHVGLPHAGVAAFGPDKGFELQILRTHADFDPDTVLCFTTDSGRLVQVLLLTLTTQSLNRGVTNALIPQFREKLPKPCRLLDIGGRDRSGVDRSRMFPDCDVTVLDIVEGQNVDVVGDAHKLSRYFPPEHFDATFSVSVFEHLMMPWKVVLEMNKVMKTGGMGFVFTHQTLGMHDLPWDFWRYSDNAWKALFNARTGFRILATAMDRPQFILPLYFSMDKQKAEMAAGFEGSAVLFTKTGPASEAWRTEIEDIDNTEYPH